MSRWPEADEIISNMRELFRAAPSMADVERSIRWFRFWASIPREHGRRDLPVREPKP